MTTSSTPERPSVVRRSVAAGRPETKYAEAYDGPRMQLRIEQRRDEPGRVRTAVMRHSRREASDIRRRDRALVDRRGRAADPRRLGDADLVNAR